MSLWYEVQTLLRVIREYTAYVDRLKRESYIFSKNKWEIVFPYRSGDDFVILMRKKEERC